MRKCRLAWVVCFLFLTSAACSSPYDAKLPAGDPKNWSADDKLAASIRKLPGGDQELLKGYLVRHVMASAFGAGGLPEGVTVRAAIDEQKKFDADRKAKEAEEKALADRVNADRAIKSKALLDAATVAITGFTLQKSDWEKHRLQDQFVVRVAFSNKTPRAISGIKGRIHFSNLFGDLIKSVDIASDQGVAANSVAETQFEMDYNRFNDADKNLANAQVDKLKVAWEPTAIIFEDGTSLVVN